MSKGNKFRRRQTTAMRKTVGLKTPRQNLLAILLAAPALIAAAPSYAQTTTWIGHSRDWLDPTNWTFGVPSSITEAIIDTPAPSPPWLITSGAEAEKVIVGDIGAGSLYILGSGTLSNRNSYVGNHAGSLGVVEVNGSAATWTMSGYLGIGSKGMGVLEIRGGGTVNSDWATIGIDSHLTNNVMVTGPGSTWTNVDGVVIGGGVGTMAGTGSLAIQNGGKVIGQNGVIARSVDSIGTVAVSGTDSAWNNSNILYVGRRGIGSLSVEAGGAVTSDTGFIGEEAEAQGMVTITGPGSTWANNNYLYVGNFGKGQLTVSNGGKVRNRMGAMGREAGSEGTILVTDVGSTWTHNGMFTVGDQGVGALTIAAGGEVFSNSQVNIAQDSTSNGSVVVTGPGSVWRNASQLAVGMGGKGSLLIENGGVVNNAAPSFIAAYGDSQGAVTVTGTGSTWINNDHLIVGEFGKGELAILNGGQVSNSKGSIGRSEGGEGRALVTGPGSTWTSNDVFLVGDEGSGALNVADGGKVVSNSQSRIGERETSVGTVKITGPGSQWNNADQFAVGFWGKGSLLIEDGAFVGSGQSFIGSGTGSNGAVTLAGLGSGWTVSGGLVVGQEGSGSLNIGTDTAVNASGLVLVADQPGSSGALLINGLLATSSVNVNAGGWLGGAGTINGNTSVAGTVAPGNSIGTFTVVGNYAQHSGSTYVVELDAAGNSDLIDVSGTALIEGGMVHAVPLDGFSLDSDYTILTASAGVSGAFDEATMASGFAFLTPDLNYDANNIFLTLTQSAPLSSVAWTPNQTATAEGIDSLGHGTPIWDAVIVLDADSARSAFDSLSGEIHASAKSALLEDSHFLRDAVYDRLHRAFNNRGVHSAAPNPGTSSVARSTPASGGSAAWARPFGSWGDFDSDGNAASLSTSTGGFFMGGDSSISENWRLGVLAGYNHTSFDADDRSSSGSSDTYHLALYGGAQWDKLGLRAGLAHSWHDIDTKRTAAFQGFSDNLRGDYHARTVQAFSELGYRIDAGTVSLEPFANLAYVNLHTDRYTEEGGAAALTAPSEITETTFSTLGVRASADFTLGTMPAKVRGLFGWRHAFGNVTPMAKHAFTDSDTFKIAGVPIAKNAAVISAGIDLNVTDNAILGLSYAGQLGSGVQQHGAVANFTLRF